MKSELTALLLSGLLCFPAAAYAASLRGGHPAKQKTYSWERKRKFPPQCTDMVLIYGGGRHRTPYAWDKESLTPYVVYTDSAGRSHWLFDSFLFLEFMDGGKGGTNRGLAKGYRDESATKSDWERLIDYYFISGTGIDALDKAAEEAAAKTGRPDKKRQVVVSIPEPIVLQRPKDASSPTKYWGEIGGRELDFSMTADRIAACKWYIDRIRAIFNEKKYRNVELAGFYWLAEQASDTREMLSAVASYLSGLKYSFNWIPYYSADGYKDWRSFGFSRAYYQPNHFFSDKIPDSRLDAACGDALKYGMGMEMEFDDRAMERTGWGGRLRKYMEAFTTYGIWADKPIAYYQGNRSLLALKKSENPADRKLYRDFCEFVISRPVRATH